MKKVGTLVFIEYVNLENFTVFKDLSVELSKGINVFIGKNGTGKTHLLKAIYAACEASKDYDFGVFNLESCFQGSRENLNLFNDKNNNVACIRLSLNEVFKNITLSGTSVAINNEYKEYYISIPEGVILKSVYIPVKDMLTHSKGLLAMADKYKEFPFNKTLLNIIKKANQWTLKKPPVLSDSILPILEKLIGGQVVVENEEFYIQKQDGQMVNFSVEAEGFKKIGLLWRLLMNESITENSILIWDEPEANINPDFIPNIVECLLELSRHNIQIFVSTHNYLFAKYFDVRRKDEDSVMFHALYKDTDNKLQSESKGQFHELLHNDIMMSFEKLLNEVYNQK